MRGTSFTKYKQMRERLNQFYLKNKDGKAPISEDRMNTLPQNATITRTNHLNTDLLEEDSDTESYASSEDGEDDNIEKRYYSEMDDDMLPNPSVNAFKTLLQSPKTNSGMTNATKIYAHIGTQNMNKISLFPIKLE